MDGKQDGYFFWENPLLRRMIKSASEAGLEHQIGSSRTFVVAVEMDSAGGDFCGDYRPRIRFESLKADKSQRFSYHNVQSSC